MKKFLILTGSSGFLGQAISKHLLKNYNLILIDKIKPKSLKINSNSKFYKIDITSKKEVSILNKKLLKKKISISGIINNASFNPKPGINHDTTIKDFEVSILGSVNLINEFKTNMIKKSGGKIINIGSDLSVIAPTQSIYKKDYPNYKKPASYTIIKHALVGLTKYFAAELAPHNISVNILSPGGIYNNHPSNFVNSLTKLIPAKRMCSLNDVVFTLESLLQNKSNYLTGQNILVDGGRTII